MSGHVLPRHLVRRSFRPTHRSGWTDWLAAMIRVVRTRRHLVAMDARMLKDIGLSRADADREANRLPWDFR